MAQNCKTAILKVGQLSLHTLHKSHTLCFFTLITYPFLMAQPTYMGKSPIQKYGIGETCTGYEEI